MKTKPVVLFILLILIFAIFSCNKEEEQEKEDPRDIITGNWLCTEVEFGSNEQEVFDVTVKAVPGSNTELDLINFAHLNGIVRGHFGGDTVWIPEQTVDNSHIVGTGYIISAYGSNWVYTETTEGVDYKFYAGFKKKY